MLDVISRQSLSERTIAETEWRARQFKQVVKENRQFYDRQIQERREKDLQEALESDRRHFKGNNMHWVLASFLSHIMASVTASYSLHPSSSSLTSLLFHPSLSSFIYPLLSSSSLLSPLLSSPSSYIPRLSSLISPPLPPLSVRSSARTTRE